MYSLNIVYHPHTLGWYIFIAIHIFAMYIYVCVFVTGVDKNLKTSPTLI